MIDSLIFIAFLFIGHSNLSGYCSGPNPGTTSPHVWLYSHTSHAIYHGKDSDKASVVIPFLEEMALRYPDYNFIGVKCDKMASSIKDYLPGNTEFDRVKRAMDTLKSRKYVLGGVIAMFGFIESTDTVAIDNFAPSLQLFKWAVCSEVKNDKTPVILAKYEMNASRKAYPQNYTYAKRLENKIELLEQLDHSIKCCPIRDVPAQHFCDDHHYNADGYRIFAEDAAVLYQENHFDFWNKGNK